MKKKSVIMVVVAGVLWGSMGVFVRWFDTLGFSSLQTAAMRIISSAVALCVISGIFYGKSVFKIRLCDAGWFLLSGVFSVFGMSWLYFEAINRSSMCVSAILLYTAPFIVTLLSCIFFGERFSLKKLIALVVAFLGCVFVTGTGGDVTLPGVMFGIGSGVAYASYSVFSKVLLKKYSPMTVTVYSFSIASLVYLAVSDMPGVASLISSCNSSSIVIVVAVVMGVVTATAPFLLYTYGLKGMDAGKASVIAYIEPLVASVFGYLIFGEFSGISGIFGIILIIFAVLLINNFGRNQNE